MRVTYLSGGVGGAKLALGLSRILPPDDLDIIANTGDDFVHLGFPVCPDIDTLVYTLSGLANTELGWGRRDESGHFMETMKQLGGPDWFFLGDRDLAMHAARRDLLDLGMTLTQVTAKLSGAVGVEHRILPMCDVPAPTIICTSEGDLDFQDYFVRKRAVPEVTGLRLHGGAAICASETVIETLHAADLIVIGPSNPFISIDPILMLEGISEALRDSPAPVVAVSPIVGGAAIKGPTAKMMKELGLEVSATAVAERYADVATHFVLDDADATLADAVQRVVEGVSVTGTVMKSLEDRIELARHVLNLSGP